MDRDESSISNGISNGDNVVLNTEDIPVRPCDEDNNIGTAGDEQDTHDLSVSQLLAENVQLKRRLEEMDKELSILRRNRIEGESSGGLMQIETDLSVISTSSDEILSSENEESPWRLTRAWRELRGTTQETRIIPTEKKQIQEQRLIQRKTVKSTSTVSTVKANVDDQLLKARSTASHKSKNSDDFCADNEVSVDDEEVGCLIDEGERKSRPEIEDVTCSLPNTENRNNEEPFKALLIDRSSWLVGLLVMQSLSGFILQSNEQMLREHTVIVNFLTMLVGAGGNAGNQASVRVIRGLAVGTLNSETRGNFLWNEAKMAVCLGAILGLTGFIRAAVFLTPRAETTAITSSLISIVVISIGLGSLLPLGMEKLRIDPAHSSTTIQVVMDILGVSITCWVCTLILKTGFTEPELDEYGNSTRSFDNIP